MGPFFVCTAALATQPSSLLASRRRGITPERTDQMSKQLSLSATASVLAMALLALVSLTRTEAPVNGGSALHRTVLANPAAPV